MGYGCDDFGPQSRIQWTIEYSKPEYLVRTKRKKEALTFGEFIAATYRACSKRRAGGIVRLAVNARLVKFPGQRFVIS